MTAQEIIEFLSRYSGILSDPYTQRTIILSPEENDCWIRDKTDNMSIWNPHPNMIIDNLCYSEDKICSRLFDLSLLGYDILTISVDIDYVWNSYPYVTIDIRLVRNKDCQTNIDADVMQGVINLFYK